MGFSDTNLAQDSTCVRLKLHNYQIFILCIFIFILVRSPQALRVALADPAEGPSLTILLTSRIHFLSMTPVPLLVLYI